MKLLGKKNVIIFIFAGIVVGIAALLLLKPGYEVALRNYYHAIEKNDTVLYATRVMPKFWSRYIAEGSGEEYVLDHAERDLRGCREDLTDSNEYQNPIPLEITYKITEKKNLSEREMYTLMDHMYDSYGYYIFNGKDDMNKHITDAIKLFVSFEVTSRGDTYNYHYPDGITFIKEDGKWYLSPVKP